MRTLISFALAASLALVLGASQASATSSIDLVLLSGGSGGEPCTNGTEGVDCTHAVPSDVIKFALVINVDSLGITSFSFDLAWDEDGENELDLANHNIRGSLNFAIVSGGSPPTTTNLGYTMAATPSGGDVQESEAAQQGFIRNWTAIPNAVLLPFPSNVSFRVGRVSFHVNGNVNKNAGADIVTNFQRPGGSTFGISPVANGSPFEQVTPNFGSFAVDSTPEPGTSLLMGLGVLGLILAGRASRKS